MKVRNALAVLAAAGLALAPVASNATASLSIARAAPQMSGSSNFADDESNHGGGSVAVILGVLLLVLIGVGVTSHGSSLPRSP